VLQHGSGREKIPFINVADCGRPTVREHAF